MEDAETASASLVALLAASLTDHTALGDAETVESTFKLCEEAATSPCAAAVCVWPAFVRQAREALEKSCCKVASTEPRPKVATVVNFPRGKDLPEVVAAEAMQAVSDGAEEVDLVINYEAFQTDLKQASAETVTLVRRVKQAIGSSICLKVILETGALQSAESIRAAAKAAIEGGADFLKTSTGKISVGATPEAVRILVEVSLEEFKATDGRRLVGVKVSGGVRTADDASRYMRIATQKLGVAFLRRETFRFGASSLLANLREVVAGKKPAHGASPPSAY